MTIDFNEAVSVTAVPEEYAFIAAHPCPICSGDWKVRQQELVVDAEGCSYDRLDVVCRRCKRRQVFLFRVAFLGSGPVNE
jgi:hypothetical protein